MVLQADTAWIVSVLLCSVRLGAALAMTPILGGFSIPVHFRAFLVLGLSAVLVSGLPVARAAVPGNLGGLVMQAGAEVGVGALLAFGIFSAFAVFALAGKLLDIQIGFGIGNVFDPVTRSRSPMVGAAFDILAIVAFFAVDGHHALLRGIAYSLQQVPLGGPFPAFSVDGVVRQFGMVFTLGLLFAAPVVFCLFFTEIGLAVLSRNLPQMNLFVVGVPVKTFVGLTMLALSAGTLGPVLMKAFTSIFVFWQGELG